jgi:hypothetical protein
MVYRCRSRFGKGVGHRPIAAIVLVSFVASGCGAGKLPPGAPAGDRSTHYENVDLYVQEAGEAQDYDVRLVFDPQS